MSTRDDRTRHLRLVEGRAALEDHKLPYEDRLLERQILAEVAEFTEAALRRLPQYSPWRDDFARDVRELRIVAGLPVTRPAGETL